jgi:hypothetical protein
VLGGAAAEVQHEPIAIDGCAQNELQVAFARLDDVARGPSAVAERRDRRPRAPLRIVQHRRQRAGQRLGTETRCQLHEP